MGISIQSLRVFLCVLDRGSFSAAGRELGITQPAVSNHLHALEERFGVALLARGRGARATPAGECLAGHARRVLEALETLEEEMARHSAPHGRLLVGASSTPGEYLLPRLAVRFAAEYPEVSLDVHIGDTEETLTALLERRIEVAVVGREVDEPRVDSVVIEEEELVPAAAVSECSITGEVEPAALANRPFIMRERGSATREVVEGCLAAAGFKPRIAMELGSNAAVAGAVATGAGIGILPARTLESQEKIGRLPVRSLELRRPFVMLVEKGRPLSPAAEAFTALCLRKDV
ncbi:MAG: LysR family transcriptional regulator [Actinomycetota bacterium]|nr:LysR family transcriptional regulator [Actinomycetota bacterium]